MLARFARDARGNVAMLFAIVLPVLLAASAFALDEAALYRDKRIAQSAVDLAALSAARDPGNAERIVRDILGEHGLPADAGNVTVETGRYTPDAALDPAARFAPGPGAADAVRVLYRTKGRLHFAAGFRAPPDIGVTATATSTPEVAFSVGSRLAALDGGLANQILDGLLGSSVSLDLMSYRALAGAEVDLFGFLDALATELDLGAVTYDEVVAAEADRGAIAAALVSVIDGPAADAARALEMALESAGADDVPVLTDHLVDPGPWGRRATGSVPGGVRSNISALTLATLSAALADGTHQVALELEAGVPGVLDLALDVAVGEPPQAAFFTVGTTGAVAHTAQTRIRLVATLAGNGATRGGLVRLPLYVEIAHAEARVAHATCPNGTNAHGSATIETLPGVARLAIGAVGDAPFADFGGEPDVERARLLDLLLLRITGHAAIEAGAVEAVPLEFSRRDVRTGTVHTASTRTPVESAVTSLLRHLDLDVEILGLGLGADLVARAVLDLIVPVAPVLDATVLTLLDALGVSIGQADVRVHGVTCSQPTLVG